MIGTLLVCASLLAVDGDTIKCDGVNLRDMGDGAPFVSGYDTPEVGRNAKCRREREMGEAATDRMAFVRHGEQRMPRYFFNMIDGTSLYDDVGVELPDIEAAHRHATGLVHDWLRDTPACLGSTVEQSILITDSAHNVLGTLKVSQRFI